MQFAFCLSVHAQAPAAIEVENCIVDPLHDVTLSSRSPEPGPIVEINVKEGQAVKKGGLLARLADEVYRLDVQRLQRAFDDSAAVDKARKLVELRQWELGRKKQIEKSLAPDELKQAELELDFAQLELLTQELQRELIEIELNRRCHQLEARRIVSPIDGVVEKIYVQVGETVQVPQKVVQVVSLGRLKIEVSLDVRYVRQVQVGDSASIIVDRFEDTPLEGEVVHVALVDFGSHTFLAVVHADNPGGKVRTGMRATVTLRPQSPQTTTNPLAPE